MGKRRLGVLAVAMALLVASCGGGDQPALESPGAGDSTEEPSGNFVKIGLLGDLTGKNSNLVTPARDAARLAFEQANEKGDLPVRIRLEQVDNKDGGKDPAPDLADKLIGDSKVVGVIGPAFSGETASSGARFAAAGLTHITQSATGPDLTKNGWKTFFRALASDDVQGGQTGDYIVKGRKLKKVALVNDKSEYGAGLAKAVADSVKKAGGQIVLDEGIEPTTDYRSIVDTVAARRPDVFYYAGYVGEGPLVVEQYRAAEERRDGGASNREGAGGDRGGKALFMAGDGVKGAKFISDGGKAAEGAILTCPCLDPNAAEDEASKKFASDFKKKYNREADIYSAEGWDVAQIFIAAVKAAGPNPTREAILQFVTNLKDFKGLSKTFNWTPEHEVKGGEITYVYEVKDKKYKLLGRVDELTK
ncbi:MAG TPA: branched-chain amino acid ABC transporter substrate-binding protein [Actinomycetota bacterium]|nr:branched-chain amino acid ABC transporter substrate-binding protein [Actinomycetota bacterium]